MAEDTGNITDIDISKTTLTGKSRKEKARIQAEKEAQVKAALSAKITEITPSPVMGTSRGRRPMTGRLVMMPCPLYPAYTDEEGVVHPPLVVGFKVDNQQKYLSELPDSELVGGAEYIEKAAYLISLIAPVFRGWDFLHPVMPGVEIPCPDPEKPETYQVLLNPSLGLEELCVWIGGLGLASAVSVAVGQPVGMVERIFAERGVDTGAMINELRALAAAPIGGPGYDAALEASLPPNSASA